MVSCRSSPPSPSSPTPSLSLHTDGISRLILFFGVVCWLCCFCHLFCLVFSLLFPPQVNTITGHVRPIKRMVADRSGIQLPRCPKENIPLTNFREGTNYSLVPVTKASKIEKRKKKNKGRRGKVKFSRGPFIAACTPRPPSDRGFVCPPGNNPVFSHFLKYVQQ